MGCQGSKDKDQKALREQNVRAALGARDKPQALRDRHRAKQEEEEEGGFFEGVPSMQPAAPAPAPKPKRALPSDWTKGGGGKKTTAPETESESESEQEEEEKSQEVGVPRERERARGTNKPRGSSSSEAVKGGLLEQLADQKEKSRTLEQERNYLRDELAAVREKEDTDRKRGLHEKRHEKTEIQAHQEMTEAANKKADKLEAEIAKMKRTLSELFSQQILDQMFPRSGESEALKNKREKAAKQRQRKDDDGLLGGVFGMGSKKPKLAKGTEELLEIMQDQTKEFKELKRERDKLKHEVSQWEKDYEKQQEAALGQGGVLGIFQGTPASEWEDKFHSKARECDDLAKQLKSAQDAARSMQLSLEEAGAGALVEAPDGSPDDLKSPTGGNWFTKLLKSEDKPSSPADEPKAIVASSNGSVSDAAVLAKSAHLETEVKELQIKLQKAEKGTRTHLEELVQHTASMLSSRQETTEMLEDQRAGALEQLSQLQVDYERTKAELRVLKTEGGIDELSDAQELECARQQVEALEEQVQDVVSANKDLFTQTSEAMEENTSLSSQLEEQARHCERLEEAMLDAQTSARNLQEGHDAMKQQVEELLNGNMNFAKGNAGDDQDVAHSIENMQSCIAVLQSSKAVSDCEVWRSRCVELESQRDTALEVALCISKAHSAEEATEIILNYLG